jgi:hypothetical protein
MEVEYSDSVNTNICNKNNINNILNNKNLSIDDNEVIIEAITNPVKYDHSRKMEIVKKINKIKKKEYLIEIFKIITSKTDDYSENNNGVFIFFHNLSDDTYEKVETYVNNIYKLHKHITNTTNIFNSELSDSNILSETIEISNNDKNLSNKEKMLMRRKKYEEYLNHNQD